MTIGNNTRAFWIFTIGNARTLISVRGGFHLFIDSYSWSFALEILFDFISGRLWLYVALYFSLENFFCGKFLKFICVSF